jgi:glycosyltransferase involved in cell wall biosynthesis
MKKLSVIIITKNEERNIKDCLDSVIWADEIIVVDDESSDNTLKIITSYEKVKFFVRKMIEGFGPQKNFALSKATGEWVLSIDADERVTEELKKEILEKINTETFDGYYLKRYNLVFGKIWREEKPSTLRLFKKDKGKFTEVKVHERVVINGKVSFLKNPLLHFSKALNNVEEYINTYINDYTTRTVSDLETKGIRIKSYNLIYYFIIKPILIFIQKYFFKLYFKKGIRGLILAQFVAIAYLISYIKLWEKQEKNNFEKLNN